MFGQDEWELFKLLAGPSGVCVLCACVCVAKENKTVGVMCFDNLGCSNFGTVSLREVLEPPDR